MTSFIVFSSPLPSAVLPAGGGGLEQRDNASGFPHDGQFWPFLADFGQIWPLVLAGTVFLVYDGAVQRPVSFHFPFPSVPARTGQNGF